MMRTRLCVAVAAVAVVTIIAGCGGRTLTGTYDAATNSNTNTNNGNSNYNIGVDAGVNECDDDQCVVGIRTDNCCEAAFATTLNAVSADPCLELWPQMWDAVPQACLDAWDPECDYIDCMPGPPRWRTTRCTTPPTGVCEMVPECGTASDCVLGMDHRKCCPCPEGLPPGLIERDPCLTAHPSGGVTVPTQCYPTMCPEMPCAQCTENPPECTSDGACWNDNPGW